MTDSAIAYIHHVMRETGMTASALATHAGLSTTTLTRPLDPAGDHSFRISRRTIEKIVDATGIAFSEKWGPRQVGSDDGSITEAKLVPIYDIQASAGFGALVEYEERTGSLAFPPDYLKILTSSDPRNLAIITVKGDSMEPTLLDDDVVLVDMSKRHTGYEGMFVLRHNDTLLVKRAGMAPRNGYVMLISDNKAYPTVEAAIEEVHVVGKVLWYGRKV